MAWNTLFTEFPLNDQIEWSRTANLWFEKHWQHVTDIMLEEREYAYPPSGSDCGKPELWKGASWNWFFEREI